MSLSSKYNTIIYDLLPIFWVLGLSVLSHNLKWASWSITILRTLLGWGVTISLNFNIGLIFFLHFMHYAVDIWLLTLVLLVHAKPGHAWLVFLVTNKLPLKLFLMHVHSFNKLHMRDRRHLDRHHQLKGRTVFQRL